MFGGFSSEHFWIDGLRLRAATLVDLLTCCQSMVEIPEAVDAKEIVLVE